MFLDYPTLFGKELQKEETFFFYSHFYFNCLLVSSKQKQTRRYFLTNVLTSALFVFRVFLIFKVSVTGFSIVTDPVEGETSVKWEKSLNPSFNLNHSSVDFISESDDFRSKFQLSDFQDFLSRMKQGGDVGIKQDPGKCSQNLQTKIHKTQKGCTPFFEFFYNTDPLPITFVKKSLIPSPWIFNSFASMIETQNGLVLDRRPIRTA